MFKDIVSHLKSISPTTKKYKLHRQIKVLNVLLRGKFEFITRKINFREFFVRNFDRHLRRILDSVDR